MSTTTHDTGTEGIVDQAKAGFGEVGSTVQDKAVELKEQGRSKLGETLDQRTTEVGAQARQAAQALRQSGSQMSPGDGSSQQVAHIVELVADRVEWLGGYLEKTSGDQLVRDAEEFARRRPWMVAGLGLFAGLAASRFLKASSERRYGAYAIGPTGHHTYSTAIPAGGSAYRPPTGVGAVSGG
jgi:ElaB/YqjD/DUF883 family membrane-anchored ribosome-binding protein